jgi:epoxyqueuosine reductase QueG
MIHPCLEHMVKTKIDLEKLCVKMGSVAFGIVSAKALDSLKRVRIKEGPIDKWSIKVRSVLPDAESVVLFAIRTKDDADDMEVRRGEEEWDYPGYLPLVTMQKEVIHALKEAGFKAIALPELVTHKRAALLAGIGAYGKNSMIINPKYGLTLRFYGVITNARLRLSKPSQEDLCQDCERCVLACPTKVLRPYVMTDPRKCLVDMRESKSANKKYRKMIERHEPMLTPNSWKMCTVCQMVCPFTPKDRKLGRISGT